MNAHVTATPALKTEINNAQAMIICKNKGCIWHVVDWIITKGCNESFEQCLYNKIATKSSHIILSRKWNILSNNNDIKLGHIFHVENKMYFSVIEMIFKSVT